MLKQWFRVLYSDNGTLTDKSILASSGDGFSVAMTADEDYIYVGQYFPFNNIFFQISATTATNATLSVEYWADNQWRSALDVIDGTQGLKNSGVLQFTPDKDYAWREVQDTGGSLSDGPEELSTIRVYDLYWLRIKASQTLAAAKTIKKMGYAFCRSEDLKIYEPEIDQYLVPWGGASKTDWLDQIVAASEQVVLDLKAKQLVMHPGQILRFDDVCLPTILKTLLLLYVPLGPAFEERRNQRQKDYAIAMNNKRFTFDQNQSATVERAEIVATVGTLVR